MLSSLQFSDQLEADVSKMCLFLCPCASACCPVSTGRVLPLPPSSHYLDVVGHSCPILVLCVSFVSSLLHICSLAEC